MCVCVCVCVVRVCVCVCVLYVCVLYVCVCCVMLIIVLSNFPWLSGYTHPTLKLPSYTLLSASPTCPIDDWRHHHRPPSSDPVSLTC